MWKIALVYLFAAVIAAVMIYVAITALAPNAEIRAQGVPQAAPAALLWVRLPNYTIPVTYEQCLPWGAEAYCIGGNFAGENFGISIGQSAPTWRSYGYYPLDVIGQACSSEGNMAVCVGGTYPSYKVSNAVYYADYNASAASFRWIAGDPYPVDSYGSSCTGLSNRIYCVGGEESYGGTPTNHVYFANVSASGGGEWTNGPSYPMNATHVSCVPIGDSIYCIGGYTSSNGFSDRVYSLNTTAGAGWTQATSYPMNITMESCVPYGTTITCIGGFSYATGIASTYTGQVSENKISWMRNTDFPRDTFEGSCALLTSGKPYILCVAGTYDGEVYYSQV